MKTQILIGLSALLMTVSLTAQAYPNHASASLGDNSAIATCTDCHDGMASHVGYGDGITTVSIETISIEQSPYRSTLVKSQCNDGKVFIPVLLARRTGTDLLGNSPPRYRYLPVMNAASLPATCGNRQSLEPPT